ncbi:tripartite tricarboxylate transporter TctB family protein [Natrarchaeobaculum sulfurireducens]|uniref:Tripartite tricarboxylate transporter TctB family protein n=1 Tax=Natrarchaeobaculum sulfurireducens TaxID=2044521 RepID=A0A346PCX0_9EURY|nr:tripartite tricarboxylate transporter TctB family protein [Natrarchaeobaculum sulfurireducens]AXR77365.1 hypothetical protein AArc1_1024 [Natrarchaeobaculum sulfurireducens]AXR82670.1 hypothetical protein AArcMg_2680 [Natrarchaeobaculum sulfurireducens]
MESTLSRTLRTALDALADAGTVVLGERPTMEHLLLSVFLLSGLYMIWGAREFSADAATFPRVTAGAMVVFSALLLARNYLPGPLRSVATTPVQLLSSDDTRADIAGTADAELDQSASRDSAGSYTYDVDDPCGPAVVAGLCVLYTGLTFTIGMLYATPIFVGAYALWARLSLPRATVLVAGSFGIAYAFFLAVTPEIAVGWYTGWRFPVPVAPDLPVSTLLGGDPA